MIMTSNDAVTSPEHRTVFVVHDAPYPPRSGAPLRAWQNINILARLGPVHVFSVGLCEPDATMPIASSWTHIDATDYPMRSAGALAGLRRAIRPRQYPIENDFVTDEINGRLSALIDRVQPTVIVISHWHDALPDALKGRHIVIADTHNVESSLLEHLLSESGRLSLRNRYRLFQWRRRERDFLNAVDRIWVTSPDDAKSYAGLHKNLPPIDIWPNAVDMAHYRSCRTSRVSASDQWPTIGYAGFFGYRPNEEAALRLIRTIFPQICSVYPNARLMLIGKAPSKAMTAAAATQPGVVLTGAVDDICPYLHAADLTIVPLTTGGGTRLKLLEAFAARIAVISTPKGAEGIDAREGLEIELADVDGLAARAIALLNDRRRYERQVDAAYELVESRYSWDALVPKLPTALGFEASSGRSPTAIV